MKKTIFVIFLFASMCLTSYSFAQVSVSKHEHETEAPDPSEEIRMEKKNTKKHERIIKKEKERHARHNLKMEKKRIKHSGDVTFGAIGYDNGAKYSGRAHKRHLKSKRN